MGLLGPDGKPISTAMFANKKKTPKLGEQYGRWSGPDADFFVMPGGGALQFDLDRLTIADFRQMRDHYQVNSSLTLLMFLMHQMEWRVVCENKKHENFYNEALADIWTPLVRSMSRAFWAGFSPNILQWDNQVGSRRVIIDKIKDLVPESAEVRWRKDGPKDNKVSVYDGILQWGSNPIPVDNTFWYPLLMEQGNYAGTKLLRSAFQPWFFSILVHLFANRYYERFGEPTPVGRAPYDEDIRYMGQDMQGSQAMELILQNLRSRATVVLPNDKTPAGDETNPDFDYQIEYLESQMRGADFERYMTRLDEEISLALFTPILMMRTADVGSYSLGDTHTMVYKWMLNAVAGDWKHYIDWYILRPLRNWNFGQNAPMPKISFRKNGGQNEELVRDIVRAMVSKGGIKPEIEQLGEIAGLKLSEVKELTKPEEVVPGDPTQPSQADDPSDGSGSSATENRAGVASVIERISARLGTQVLPAIRKNKLRDTEFDLGHQSQIEAALRDAGHPRPEAATQVFYQSIEHHVNNLKRMETISPAEFLDEFKEEANRIINTFLGGEK